MPPMPFRSRKTRPVSGGTAPLAERDPCRAGEGKAALADPLFPHDHDPEEYAAQAQSIFPAAECGFDGKSITLQYEEAQP